MEFNFNFLSISLFIAAVVSAITTTAIFFRSGHAVKTFAIMMLGATIWAFSYSFELAMTDLDSIMFWIRLEYIGISLIPALWIIFILQFTGNEKYLNGKTIALIYLLPVITLIMVWTNSWHHLHYESYEMVMIEGLYLLSFEVGAWYIIHTIIFYCFLVLGFMLLIFKYRREKKIFKKQILTVIFGTSIPWFINILYLFDFKPLEHLDLTPFAFIFTGVIISFGLLRFKLFEVLPFAREKIIEEMAEGIVILDTIYHVIDSNPAFRKTFNTTEMELYGKPVFTLFPNDDLFFKNLERQESISFEYKYQFQDEPILFEVTIKPILVKHGEVNGFFVVFRDITETKRAQEELTYAKELLEETGKLARVGGWHLDLEVDELVWTTMTKTIFEVDPDYEPELDSAINFYYDEKSRNEVRMALEKSIRKNESFSLELPIETAKGNKKWVFAIGNPKFKGKKCIKLYGSVQDITEKKRTESRLLRAKKMAESANKAKTEFLANMSHEIRTPLNGIIGFSDLLMQSELKEDQKRYMNIVFQSANSLLEILNDILDLSKIEAGRMELDPASTDIQDLAAKCIDILRFQAENKKLSIRYHIDDEVPRYLILDELRVRQVLINLLGNSIKFTTEGEIELIIQMIEGSKKRETVRFSVRDTGIGISKSNLKRIFQAFSQEDNSITRKYGGTGLGLTISNRILQLMNSKLTVMSEVDEGSVFSFDLDAVVGEEAIIKVEDSNSSENSDSISEKQNHLDRNSNGVLAPKRGKDEPLKILIAEDNDTNRFLMKIILLNLYPHATFLEAKNGDETVGIFKSEFPDVILMDVQMPFKSGYEATKEIRSSEEGEKIPIIACTAGALKGERDKCLMAGMNDYISKPIIKESVKRVMEKWVMDSGFEDIVENTDEIVTSSENHYNREEMRQRYGDVLDILEDLLAITKTTLSESRESFEELLQAEKLDFELIGDSAHKVKGTALAMSFGKLASIAVELEVTPPSKPQFARKLIEQMIDEIDYLEENIHEL